MIRFIVITFITITMLIIIIIYYNHYAKPMLNVQNKPLQEKVDFQKNEEWEFKIPPFHIAETFEWKKRAEVCNEIFP